MTKITVTTPKNMLKKSLIILSALFISSVAIHAQDVELVEFSDAKGDEKQEYPVMDYNTSKTYEIAEITISGLKNPMYEDHVLINFSGLSIGDKVEMPGAEITTAAKRFWKQGLWSFVRIKYTKVVGSKVWLEIEMEERPRISDILYTGVKKSEKDDLNSKIGLIKELQITPDQLNKAEKSIKKYFDEKGFNKATIDISQEPDLSKDNYVFLKIDVQKKHKTKVNAIYFEGNKEVSSATLEKSMKKTRHKSTFMSWVRNFLRSTNYIPNSYEEDKEKLIDKYNELGYRDATILSDTVYTDSKNASKVNVEIKVDEGDKYYIRDIKWAGNTEYPTSQLGMLLNMKPGDVYNQKKLSERLLIDEQSVMNYFYKNHGYIAAQMDPVEVNIEKDSIDLEIRIYEGKPFNIRRVNIFGNDRLYEDVIRRELRIKPGELYSQDAIMRSLREIMQMGHFDPENLQPDINPDMENDVVDITLDLASKANDQIEFSAGWGQTGVIGKLSLKFSNFSIKNLFNPSTYKGVLPQGDGQTLTLSGQTNGRFYQSYSVSFFDPWFGGKRPNSLSVGTYYSRQTDVYSRYSQGYDPYNYGYGGYGGYDGGYGGGYYPGGDGGLSANDKKSIEIIGLSTGYGKRLNWPDDYFYFQAELSYQLYKMKDWEYFIVRDGTCNSLSLNLSLSRSTIDNPMYTRRGAEFSAGVEITPPYSWWDGKDYKGMSATETGYENGAKYKWIEYHKWKLKSKVFIPLSSYSKTPVLMTRAEFGAVGYFNNNKKSPFGTFYMGGDGMSGYSSNYATETIGLRGYENGALGSNASSYTRLGLELRYPLILEPSSTIYMLGFVEAGNAWNDLKDINPFELKRSAGAGVRIILPMIGLMGIDWAYGFDDIRGSRNRSGSQFHFVIGQEF